MNLPTEGGVPRQEISHEEHERLHRQALYCMPDNPEWTKAAQDYFFECHETIHFVGAVFTLAKKMDATIDDIVPIFESMGTERSMLLNYNDAIQPYVPLAADLLNTRVVDKFLNYLSDLFTTIYITKPEMLKTTSQMKIEEILNHSNMSELIQSIAERKVNDLAYLGFAKLVKTVSEEMKFELVSDPKIFDEMVSAIEFRNLAVHNHGIANRLYLSRIPTTTFAIGERVRPRGMHWIETLATVVADIDSRARTKFLIPATDKPSLPRFCYLLGHNH